MHQWFFKRPIKSGNYWYAADPDTEPSLAYYDKKADAWVLCGFRMKHPMRWADIQPPTTSMAAQKGGSTDEHS